MAYGKLELIVRFFCLMESSLVDYLDKAIVGPVELVIKWNPATIDAWKGVKFDFGKCKKQTICNEIDGHKQLCAENEESFNNL